MANKVNVTLDMNVQGYVDGMNQASQATEKYETDTRKIQESTVNLNKELRNAKREVQNLAAGYAQLSKEAKASAFGREMAKQLEEAKQKAAEYIDLQSDLQTELRNMASDTSTLDALSQGMGVFMNTTSAALGVVAQFTGNEEDARKAIVAFTTAQSTLNAITQITNALQKQSSLMLGVQKVQLLAAATAAKVKAAAEERGAVATAAATVAQKAFNAVAMANPYVLLAVAVVGVVGALAAFSSGTDEATKEQEKLEKQMEETRQKAEEQRNTFINAAATHHASAEELWGLYRAYKNTTDELTKVNILEQAADKFKKLGIECNNVNDAEKILTEQIATVTKLIKLQGDAAGIAALRMEKFKKEMAAMMESGYSVSTASTLASAAVHEFDKEIERINGEIAKAKGKLNINGKSFNNKNNKGDKGIKIDYEKGSLDDLNRQLSILQDKLKKKNLSIIDVKKTKEELENVTKQIEEKKLNLGLVDFEPGSLEHLKKQLSEAQNKLQKKNLSLVDVNKTKEEIESLEKQIESKQLELGVNIDYEKDSITDLKNKLSEAQNRLYDKNLSLIDKKKTEEDINALTKKIADKEIELGIKVDVDVWANSLYNQLNSELKDIEEQLINDDSLTMDARVELMNRANDLQKQLDNISNKDNLTIPATIEPKFIMKGSEEDFRKSISNAHSQINQIVEDYDNGIIKSHADAAKRISDINKQLVEMGAKPYIVTIETEFGKNMKKFMNGYEQFSDMSSGIDGVVNSFSSLNQAIENNENAWEIFMASVSAVTAIINAVQTAIEILDAIENVNNITQTTTNSLKEGESIARAANAAAMNTETGSLASLGVAESVAIAPTKALASATKQLAASQIFLAHASIPFAGVPIAAGYVTTMEAMLLSLQAFANGGIVGGNDYFGDKVLARVNSGEMVLNKQQQKTLFDAIDNNRIGGSNIVAGEIKIKGSDLYVALKNLDGKTKKLR